MQASARILIIEDNDDVRVMLREFLECAGYEVLEAANGQVGVQLYRLSPTDLIITDLVLPRKSGLEAILEVRQDFPQAKIIAISGDVGDDELDTLAVARQFGAAHTFHKPFRLIDVLEAVQDILFQAEHS